MSEDGRVLTKAALLQKARPPVEVVVHESHKKKKATIAKEKRNEVGLEVETSNDKELKTELNMKRTRFEVMKFAMAGYKAKDKEDAKVALAIELGAIPPKNKYINYKEIITQRKQEKFETEEAEKLQALGKKKKKSKLDAQFAGRGRGRGRGRGGILGQYGRVSKVAIISYSSCHLVQDTHNIHVLYNIL
jgi:hypothetical protein